jgi:steroid 5-alpha reductase family enzyme
MSTLSTAKDFTVAALRDACSDGLSLEKFGQLISHTNPVVNTISVTVLVIVVVYILGLLTGKHSFVDKAWSIVPVYYAWQFGLAELRDSNVLYPRAAVVACIITVWGVRLTFNFARKGGYAWEGEDYRWPILRERMHKVVYEIFHIVFIAIIQNVLLTSLVAPLFVSWYMASVDGQSQGFNVYDACGIILCSFCLIFEAVADQEQWDFHQRKANKRLQAAEKKLGFLTEGLWAHSRHPNFFAEQSFWVCVSLFASAATGRMLGWWLIGPLGLILLFQGSTDFTEEITSKKYPDYVRYQSQVSRLIPQTKNGSLL